MSLADKILQARKSEVKIGDFTFDFRGATLEEYSAYYNKDVPLTDVARKHITGWTGIKESDLSDFGDFFPSGSDKEIPFDKGLFDLVIAERQEWWLPLYQAIIAGTLERAAKRAESKKK